MSGNRSFRGARLGLAGIAFAGLVLVSGGPGTVARASDAENPGPEIGPWGVDLDGRDLGVKPGDDFFRYANGKWLDEFEIPEDLAGYGSFTKLFLRSEEQIKEIIEEAAASGQGPETLSGKIGTLYNTYLDEGTVNVKGLKPLDALFAEIRAAKTHEALATVMGQQNAGGGSTPFGFYIDCDEKDPSRYLPHMVQGGLGLPDRDYFLDRENPRYAEAREAYREYLNTVFTLMGAKDPGAKADRILALETRIAEVHWPKEDTRDIEKSYNLMTRDEIAKLAPEFPWKDYFTALGMGNQKDFIVSAPSAYAGMARIFKETPVEVWQDFLTYRQVRNNSTFLSKDADDATFQFFSKAITGSKEQRARWKRAVQFINGSLGEAVGQLYVERHFNETAKVRIDELVNNLLAAMRIRIDGLDWMSPETKAKARDKLDKFTVKIGYPEEWRDYTSLDIEPEDLLGNVIRAREFEHDFQVGKLGKPVDRKEWGMVPQMVNAYYNPTLNEIVFPAAILQPPFFDPYADDAVNYGGIGVVIGHEIGHGFDDQGRKVDGDGVLRDWWTDEDNDRFTARAGGLVEQYNKFSPLEGMFVNGQLTLGENIGDLGGLEIAHHAYQISLKGKEAPVLDGLTGDQRFFLGYAQIWRGKMRDELMTTLISSDPHSPVEFRVNGAVPNVDEWYDAFDVEPTDKMYLKEDSRVRIW